MNLGERECVLLLILLIEGALCQTGCTSPEPGKCSRDNTSISSDKVCGLDAGTCDFSNSAQLCSYRQGCADPGMSTWKIADGAAQAEQSGPGNCPAEYYYSVLESPWLHLTHESCLKFTYSRTRPAALDVYLKQRGESFAAVLERNHNSANSQRTNVQEYVDPGTKKVIFRAYGGGGGGGQVTVYNVSVKTGLCGWSGGIFVTTVSTDVKQGTSPFLSSTEPGTVDCLSFTYTLSSENGTVLTVSVQPLGDNRTVAVWRDHSTGDERRQGECPLQVHVPYRIIFEEKKSITTSSNILDVRWFQRSLRASDCPLNPPRAKTGDSNTAVTSTVPKQPLTAAEGCTAQGTVPWMTTESSPVVTSTVPNQPLPAAESSPRNQASTTQGGQKDANVAVISGGVAAAVIVIIAIAVIIVVIVMRRRRRLNKKQAESNQLEIDSAPPAPKTNHSNKESTADDDDPYEVTAASTYDHPSFPSTPNPYNSLNDVISATATSASPYSDVTVREAASHVDMTDREQSAANPHQSLGRLVTSVEDSENGNEYLELVK